MALWNIKAAADADDPRWMNRTIWSEVVVRAETPAEARLLAGEMEYREVGGETGIGNETHGFQSGFSDEKLYVVRPLGGENGGTWPESGPDEVLHAVRE